MAENGDKDKTSTGQKAAFITGIFAVVAAVAGVLANHAIELIPDKSQGQAADSVVVAEPVEQKGSPRQTPVTTTANEPKASASRLQSESTLPNPSAATSPEKLPVSDEKAAGSASGTAVHAEGFTFRPVACQWSRSEMHCTIAIVNGEGSERELSISGTYISKSYLYDDLGNQYSTAVESGDERSKYKIRQRFPSGLPINITFVADGVSAQAQRMTVAIAAREDKAGRTGGFEELVVIRDIPVEE